MFEGILDEDSSTEKDSLKKMLKAMITGDSSELKADLDAESQYKKDSMNLARMLFCGKNDGDPKMPNAVKTATPICKIGQWLIKELEKLDDETLKDFGADAAAFALSSLVTGQQGVETSTAALIGREALEIHMKRVAKKEGNKKSMDSEFDKKTGMPGGM